MMFFAFNMLLLYCIFRRYYSSIPLLWALKRLLLVVHVASVILMGMRCVIMMYTYSMHYDQCSMDGTLKRRLAACFSTTVSASPYLQGPTILTCTRLPTPTKHLINLTRSKRPCSTAGEIAQRLVLSLHF